MTIRSKHNDLFNYFFIDHSKLSRQYLKKCHDFLQKNKKKRGKNNEKSKI